MEGPPEEKLAQTGGEELCKSLPHHTRTSPFRVRHLQIHKTLGTRTLEKVGVSHGGIPGEREEMDPAGEPVSSPRGPIGAERESARKGRGRQGAAGGSGEEGRGAVARPPPLPSGAHPSSFPPRSVTRARPAEAGLLRGEAPTHRGGGPPPSSNGDLGGGADVARACVVVRT